MSVPASIKAARVPSVGAMVTLAAACFWIVDLGLLRGGAPHPLDDTWEFGLVASSLLGGHGFRTTMIHPPLWPLRDAALTVPVVIHGPLVPLLATPMIAAFGHAALDQVAWLAAAFATLAAACGARVAARVGGGPAAALVAALMTCSPIVLRTVHHDVSPAIGAGLAALALDLIARPDPRPFAAGLALGLGALARPELIAVAPLAAVAVGLARTPRLALGVLAPVLPWWWRTSTVAGAPLLGLSSYLLLGYTARYPELSPLRDFGLTPAAWPRALADALPSLPAKWASLAPHALKRVLVAPSGATGWLAAVGAIAALGTLARRRWAALGLAAAAIPFLLCATTESSERYVAVLLPVWALGVAAGVEAVRARLAPAIRPGTAALLAALLLAPSTIVTLRVEAARSRALRAWLTDERRALASRVEPVRMQRLLFSDTPDFAAWTTGRPTVWVTRDEYARLPARPEGTPDVGDRPARGTPLDEWFHADVRALPAPTGGGAAGVIAWVPLPAATTR